MHHLVLQKSRQRCWRQHADADSAIFELSLTTKLKMKTSWLNSTSVLCVTQINPHLYFEVQQTYRKCKHHFSQSHLLNAVTSVTCHHRFNQLHPPLTHFTLLDLCIYFPWTPWMLGLAPPPPSAELMIHEVIKPPSCPPFNTPKASPPFHLGKSFCAQSKFNKCLTKSYLVYPHCIEFKKKNPT